MADRVCDVLLQYLSKMAADGASRSRQGYTAERIARIAAGSTERATSITTQLQKMLAGNEIDLEPADVFRVFGSIASVAPVAVEIIRGCVARVSAGDLDTALAFVHAGRRIHGMECEVAKWTSLQHLREYWAAGYRWPSATSDALLQVATKHQPWAKELAEDFSRPSTTYDDDEFVKAMVMLLSELAQQVPAVAQEARSAVLKAILEANEKRRTTLIQAFARRLGRDQTLLFVTPDYGAVWADRSAVP